MKLVVSLIVIIVFSTVSLAAKVMPDIPVEVFFPNCSYDVNSLGKEYDAQLKIEVEKLFNLDILEHDFSLGYDLNAKFKDYWSVYEKNWMLLDLNKDKVLELLFLGVPSKIQDINYVELYILENEKYKKAFQEIGKVEAYKIHPNTKEIILFHHQFPCCDNASHNLNMFRYINGGVCLRKRYMVATDKNMKGNFFPLTSKEVLKAKKLNKETELRWSDEKIEKDAWTRSPRNVIARFEKGALYKVLFQNEKKSYVLMLSAPIDETNKVINTANFKRTKIYGWIID
jgi:hypothetical protein